MRYADLIKSVSLQKRRFLIALAAALAASVSIRTASAAAPEEGGFNLYAKTNLVAWCVVPFDNQRRTPAQRTQMLKELGFRSLAWDWRSEHLGTLATEIDLLRAADIDLQAVWCWIGDGANGQIGESNEQLLTILKQSGAKTDIWVSFAARCFEGLSETEKVAKGAKVVGKLRSKAQAIGCRVSLYNHGDWFGKPRNMIKIIEYLDVDDVGLVYNFHHAHDQLDEYQANLALMLPYLRTVNLNGMRAAGPKILPLSAGDREEAMMGQLKDSGFQGRIGILGHVEDADVRDVLTENLSGMQKLLRNMNEAEALATY
ncbi:MAG: AP endonuclease [Planctomycetota bacterium]